MLLGALVWLPAVLGPFRLALLFAHLLAGACWAGVAAAALLRGSRLWNSRAGGWVAAPLCLLLLLYFGRETFQKSFRPAEYDPAAVFRFLTSTTAEQAGNPLFPSAVRLRGAVGDGCARPGCHTRLSTAWQEDAHARTAGSRAYRATYRDFLRRKGPDASRWCQGCHDPARLAPEETAADISSTPPQPSTINHQPSTITPTPPHPHTPTRARGLPCAYCHRAHGPAGLFGSASMEVQGPVSQAVHPWEIRLRPEAHSRENAPARLPPLRGSSARSCHRKNSEPATTATAGWPARTSTGNGWRKSAGAGSAPLRPRGGRGRVSAPRLPAVHSASGPIRPRGAE